MNSICWLFTIFLIITVMSTRVFHVMCTSKILTWGGFWIWLLRGLEIITIKIIFWQSRFCRFIFHYWKRFFGFTFFLFFFIIMFSFKVHSWLNNLTCFPQKFFSISESIIYKFFEKLVMYLFSIFFGVPERF